MERQEGDTIQILQNGRGDLGFGLWFVVVEERVSERIVNAKPGFMALRGTVHDVGS